MEIIADVPILLEESDILITTPRKDVMFQWGSNLIRSIASALTKLYFWHEDLRNSVDKPLYTAVPSTVCNVADTSPSDKVFPFALEFLSLNNAIILSFSWSVMLQCLDTIDKLHSLQQKHVEDPPSMREMLDDTDSTSVTWSAHQQGLSETVAMYQYRLPANSSSNNFGDAKWPSIEFIKSEANRLARYLCQSMEYSHRPQLGMLATQSVTYPAWTARQHFRQHGMEKEHAWTGHMKDMTGPNFRSGTIMKFRDMN